MFFCQPIPGYLLPIPAVLVVGGAKAIDMNLNETAYERIERYLRGDLPEKEMKIVRQRIESDADFAARVEWVRDFLGLMQDEQSREVLQAFREVHQAKQRQRKLRRLKTAVAVLLTLLFAILLILWLTGGWKEPDQEVPIFEETLSPEASAESGNDTIAWQDLVEYESGLSTLGTEEDEALREAMRLLAEGRRQAALPYLETYLNSLPSEEDDFPLRLETGKIYLGEANDTERAAFHFNQVQQSDALAPYREEARYYLALTELASDDETSAIAVLRALVEEATEPIWRDKALQLLETLE